MQLTALQRLRCGNGPLEGFGFVRELMLERGVAVASSVGSTVRGGDVRDPRPDSDGDTDDM